MLISRESEVLLRKIRNSGSMPTSELEKYPQYSVDALIEKSFIASTAVDIDVDTMRYTTSDYQITDAGRAYLHSRFEDKVHFRLTFFISCIALVLSALSIVLSPYFSAFFASLYGL